MKRLLNSPEGCSFASISRDGSTLLVGTEDDIVTTFSVNESGITAENGYREHSGYINYGEFSSDGNMFVTCSNDKTAIIHSISQSKVRYRLTHHDFGVSYSTFSEDSALLCTCSWDNTAALVDTHSGRVVGSLFGHKNPVTQAAFNLNQRLVTASWDKTIRVWDLSRCSSCPMTGHTDVIWGVAFSPSSPHILASVSRDRSTSIWDTRMAGRVSNLCDVTEEMQCVRFSPDGNKLVTVGSDSTIVLRTPNNLGCPLKQTGSPHRNRIVSVAFTPCSRYLVTAGAEGIVCLWDTESCANEEVDSLSNLLNVSDMLGRGGGEGQNMGF